MNEEKIEEKIDELDARLERIEWKLDDLQGDKVEEACEDDLKKAKEKIEAYKIKLVQERGCKL